MKRWLVVAIILLAVGYQLWLVTPGYEKEALYQYDDVMEVLRLYGRSMRTDSNSESMVFVISDARRVITGMRPPLRRLPWHVLFAWRLGRCEREFESAGVVGSFAATDKAIKECADGLLPLGR